MCNNRVTVEKQKEAKQLRPNLHQQLGWINHHQATTAAADLSSETRSQVNVLAAPALLSQLLHRCRYFSSQTILLSSLSYKIFTLQRPPIERHHQRSLLPRSNYTKAVEQPTRLSFSIYLLCWSWVVQLPSPVVSGQLWTNESVVLHI